MSMKYHLPMNNLKANVNSNSFNVPMHMFRHPDASIDVDLISDDEKYDDQRKETGTSRFIHEDEEDSFSTDNEPGTGTNTGTDGNTTGTSDEGTKEVSSHPTNSSMYGNDGGVLESAISYKDNNENKAALPICETETMSKAPEQIENGTV